MRLTLRTLLAYLDGILEPGDAEDLGKKIEESEYAAGLVNRIRDSMRRLRLGAPSLTDRGPGLDPNTVAEYLDNTLASERVTDFEKVCLDSDIHLAEVAASHQILTLVLGETAEVDPAARQRIYRLNQSREKAAPPPTPTTQSTLAMPDMGTPPRLDLDPKERESSEETARKPRPKPTVPEYLREPRKKSPLWTAAAVILLAACITVVVLMVFGQFESGSYCANLLAKWGIVSSSSEMADQRPAPNSQEQEQDTPSKVEPAIPSEETTAKPEKPPVETDQADDPEPPKPPADQASETPKNDPAEAVDPEVKPSDVAPMPPPIDPATPSEEPKATPTTPSDAPPAAPVELPPEPLGRLMSSEQVLLCSGAGEGWKRVAANQMLVPQEVLALPTYRPKIALTMGVTLEILGGSRVDLLGSSAREPPGIRVLYGRVVLMPLGKAGSNMRLAFGDRTGTISFADADTVAALEVRRIRPAGSNPETGPSRNVAELFVSTGEVEWREEVEGAAAKSLRVTSHQRLAFDAQITSAPMDVENMPAWIDSTPLGALDRRASSAIADALPTDRLARVGLLELAVSRPQKEVKWLALRCLGYVGQFNDVVVALDDPAYKLLWTDYVAELCAAVGRDAETARAVRAALEKQYPQKSAQMYRMLWGYGNQGLQAGDDTDLVNALDSETLAVRVLSYWNLRDITGQGAAYQPEQTAARRQQSVRRWQQRRKAGEIRYPEEQPAVEESP